MIGEIPVALGFAALYSAGLITGWSLATALGKHRELDAERTILAFQVENDALRSVLRRGGIEPEPPLHVRTKAAIDIPLDGWPED